MADTRRVGVFIPNHAYGHSVLEGVSAFCQLHDNWKLAITYGREEAVFRHLADHLDGIIAGIPDANVASVLSAWGRPCVDISGYNLGPYGFPRVQFHSPAFSRMGAEYLLGLGFRQLAFCGYENFSRIQWDIFEQTVQQAGGTCWTHQVRMNNLDWPSIWKGIADWVAALPKPIAVLACKDSLALEVLDACRDLGVRVPDQVAVLGIGNESLLCQRANPPLSSIDPGTSRIGFQAAALLEEMMSGRPVPAQTTFLAPLGVVSRASTNMLARSDPQMAAALRYIQEHACDPIQIEDVLNKLSMSRRSLERRFVQARGHSPHEEIRRVQLQNAVRMLVQTPLPLDQVARKSGFGSADWMIKVFRKELGITPGEHRRRCRPGAAATKICPGQPTLVSSPV